MGLETMIVALALGECPPTEGQMILPVAAIEEGGFGSAMVLADPMLLVGEPLGDVDGELAGVVHMYVREGQSWNHAQTIEPPVSTGMPRFGGSIALTMTPTPTLVVSASADDSDVVDGGRAYVYELKQDQWVLAATLTAPKPAIKQFFGWSVGISGDWIIVGAPLTDTDEGGAVGVAYAFRRDRRGAWTFAQKLHPALGVIRDGGGFGSTVAMDGNFAIIGAPYLAAEFLPGHVSFFQLTKGVWVHEQTNGALFQGPRDRFGSSVSILGNVAVAGAPRDLPPNIGTVVIYERNGKDPSAPWEAMDQIASTTPAPFDRFGAAVGLSPGMLAVGASTQNDSGMVYLYERAGTSIGEETPIEPADGGEFDLFGVRVQVDAEQLIVGSPQFDGDALNSGKVYTFGLNGPVGDLNGDCAVDGADLGLLLSDWGLGGSPADLNGDGTVDGADLGLLLSGWSVGV